MWRRILFLISIIAILYFGYELYFLARDPFFSKEIILNNVFFILTMLFFSWILFFMDRPEIINILNVYYSSFKIKHIINNNYSFGSLFCWLSLAYFHYHLLKLVFHMLQQIIMLPIIFESLTIGLIMDANMICEIFIRIILFYPLPFIFVRAIKSNR